MKKTVLFVTLCLVSTGSYAEQAISARKQLQQLAGQNSLAPVTSASGKVVPKDERVAPPINEVDPDSRSEDYQRFARFSCEHIATQKDGGTIITSGTISPGIAAVIRYDGRFDSATRGRFFAKTWPMLAPVVPMERPMTKLELKGLAAAVERHLKTPESRDHFDYRLLLQHIRKTLTKEK